MSQYEFVQEEKRFVWGWDQPLQSFFLQVHDSTRPEDEQIVVWLGADKDTKMYEVEDLYVAAKKEGLMLTHEQRVQLLADKDDGA